MVRLPVSTKDQRPEDSHSKDWTGLPAAACPRSWADLPYTGLWAQPEGVRLQIGFALAALARGLAEQLQQERVQEEK